MVELHDLGQTSPPTVLTAERERRLVDDARAGDADAFTTLVERYGPPVHALCVASVLDHGEAEDLVQEIFTAAWRGLPRFRGRAAFSTWLFAIARNACVDRARRRGARPAAVSLDAAADVAATEPHERTREVMAAAARLPVSLCRAVLLRDLQGLAYEEIAQLEDIPIGTVRSRIAEGRARLAEELGR
jgi:RNA polymerase sigma-70 factor (ECF subfamily)